MWSCKRGNRSASTAGPTLDFGARSLDRNKGASGWSIFRAADQDASGGAYSKPPSEAVSSLRLKGDRTQRVIRVTADNIIATS